LLTDTAAIWFPYRSLIGVLNLTQGAWDRLVLSLSGSLPSLISSAWTTAKNIGQMQSLESDMRSGLRQRCDALVRDRLGPLISRFQQELDPVREQTATKLQPGSDRGQYAYLRGIDALQQQSHQILEQEIDRSSVRSWTAQMLGLIGTAMFWTLLSGPIFSLYAKYFRASTTVLVEMRDHLELFPAPEWSMLLTSILLSVIPTAIYAMLVITFTQRSARVAACADRIAERHATEISSLQREGVLRLELEDPVLAEAEFLVTAGTAKLP